MSRWVQHRATVVRIIIVLVKYTFSNTIGSLIHFHVEWPSHNYELVLAGSKNEIASYMDLNTHRWNGVTDWVKKII